MTAISLWLIVIGMLLGNFFEKKWLKDKSDSRLWLVLMECCGYVALIGAIGFSTAITIMIWRITP